MRGGRLAAWVLTLALALIGVLGSSPGAGACTTPAQSPLHGYDAPAVARHTVRDATPAGFVEAQLTTPLERSATRAGLARRSSTTSITRNNATNSVDDAMAGVRAAGNAGEVSAGIVKNTQRIPSLSGDAAYRIPDQLGNGVLGEVKNVADLSYTSREAAL